MQLVDDPLNPPPDPFQASGTATFEVATPTFLLWSEGALLVLWIVIALLVFARCKSWPSFVFLAGTFFVASSRLYFLLPMVLMHSQKAMEVAMATTNFVLYTAWLGPLLLAAYAVLMWKNHKGR